MENQSFQYWFAGKKKKNVQNRNFSRRYILIVLLGVFPKRNRYYSACCAKGSPRNRNEGQFTDLVLNH